MMKGILVLTGAFFLLGSCAVIRIPDFARVPERSGTYPRFTPGDSLIGQLGADREGYDVSFYDLDLTLDPVKKRLGGNVYIHFRAISNLSELRIDLYKNLGITGLKLSGEDVTFERNERSVRVEFPDPLVPGHDYILAVRYEGRPVRAKNPPWNGGIVWEMDDDGNPWIGITCETEGASLWFPCKDHLSDEPDSVRLRMTVPTGLQVVANGTLQSHTSMQGSETYTWFTGYPVNIYNITFYAGRYGHFSDSLITPEGPLGLDFYVLPQNITRAKEHFKQVKNILTLYSGLFGPYPWIKEGFRLVETPFEGMEHQTAIAYGNAYANRAWLGGDYVIVHEAAHEWWGNAVSVSDFSDIWLHEGFATYSEILFAESELGYENSLLYARYNVAASIRNRFPVVGPAGVGYWNDDDNDVYNKGAMILHTVRNVVNDSILFFNILKAFYSEHKAAAHVNTEDFKEILERKTGRDWSRFFEVYLHSREVPVLHWYYSPAGIEGTAGSTTGKSDPVIAARWTGVPEDFSMPVDFSCREGDLTVRIEVTTTPTLFLDRRLMKCKRLTCNRELSYFESVTDKSVLDEAGSSGTGLH